MGTYAPVRPTKYCFTCGGVIDTMAVVCPKCGVLQPASGTGMVESEKRILPTFLLALLFGVFGAHRFYVGKTGTAILQLLTLGGLGIWAMVDVIMVIVGAFTDDEGNKITEWI
jgi:TM2 domain-containing membrane protein YozV